MDLQSYNHEIPPHVRRGKDQKHHLCILYEHPVPGPTTRSMTSSVNSCLPHKPKWLEKGTLAKSKSTRKHSCHGKALVSFTVQ